MKKEQKMTLYSVHFSGCPLIYVVARSPENAIKLANDRYGDWFFNGPFFQNIKKESELIITESYEEGMK